MARHFAYTILQKAKRKGQTLAAAANNMDFRITKIYELFTLNYFMPMKTLFFDFFNRNMLTYHFSISYMSFIVH